MVDGIVLYEINEKDENTFLSFLLISYISFISLCKVKVR